MSSQSDVESELARLKAAQHGGAIEGSSSAGELGADQRPADAGRRRGDTRAAAGGGTGVIVRILGEGQYDVADDALARLNALDDDLEVAVEAGDEAAFAAALTALHDGVRAAGTAHAPDSLDESDVILPPSGATIDEVRELLGDDGLIPG